jgi:NADPH:quinone reductase-like Zn-dependent oxidoreductase
MRAVQIESIGKVSLARVPDPVAGSGEALVQLKAAAFNRRDLWIKLGQ